MQVSLPNYPSPEVREFGERLSECLCTASIQKSMAGLGGCKPFDLSQFPPEFQPYVEAYLEGRRDSVAVTYAAMRTKEIEAQEKLI